MDKEMMAKLQAALDNFNTWNERHNAATTNPIYQTPPVLVAARHLAEVVNEALRAEVKPWIRKPVRSIVCGMEIRNHGVVADKVKQSDGRWALIFRAPYGTKVITPHANQTYEVRSR